MRRGDYFQAFSSSDKRVKSQRLRPPPLRLSARFYPEKILFSAKKGAETATTTTTTQTEEKEEEEQIGAPCLAFFSSSLFFTAAQWTAQGR